ncbi:uncharacterized protein LOC567699 [Danio rerio]|uniref:Si:ch211-151h10.2 n=1 Tax=Danio rerio TaxID=7955 RepID=Q1LV65_DANRE|nr:uncharacterized protein LOC567699 [Danio rerio]|eukprot:NP_001038605.1 uncharacterized protein LOC567699 [Danio rerio]
MPQLSVGHVWSCWQKSRAGQHVQVVDKQMISRGVEQTPTGQWRPMSLRWSNWPRWSHGLVPIAVVWMVIQEESPLHPSVSLTEAAARLLLAALLCAVAALCALALRFLLQHGQSLKLHLPYNGDIIVEKIAGNLQGSINAQDAGDLDSQLSVVADALAVSLLYEPLPDSSEPHIRALVTRLEAVSRALQRRVYNEEEKGKCVLQDRVHQIRSYLLDRVSSLRSLLQVQRECDANVCDVQRSLQKHWALLEDLHSRVTLRPDSTQDDHEPHAVLNDTERLFTELSQFKSRVQQCRTQLENSINLLQALRSSHQHLNEIVGTAIETTWSKDLLQTNSDLFSEIQEDFMSLEQQTSNFVIHLRGLNVPEEEKTIISEADQTQTASPPAVPVYIAVPEAAQPHSDPESDQESPEASQKRHSRMSPFHMLCGRKRRTSTPQL